MAGHVYRHRLCAWAQQAAGLGGSGTVPVPQGDLRTGGQQAQRDSKSKACRTTGDNGMAPVQVEPVYGGIL